MNTTWHNPVTNPPEPLTDVLIAVRGEPLASEGCRVDADTWIYATGHPIRANEVYAWTELPACPQIPPATLKPLRVRSVKEGQS